MFSPSLPLSLPPQRPPKSKQINKNSKAKTKQTNKQTRNKTLPKKKKKDKPKPTKSNKLNRETFPRGDGGLRISACRDDAGYEKCKLNYKESQFPVKTAKEKKAQAECGQAPPPPPHPSTAKQNKTPHGERAW
jgi:hypothetical protein